MEAVRYPAYTPTPDLPAQYHYKDEQHGTEVIYLAGRDSGLEGCKAQIIMVESVQLRWSHNRQ
jgi:hypothetical protein